ncbi:hypothetical protein CERSUDRAFT_99521 [Gelatoporia subvermispora B]|uniref:DUF6534 domain-containing protein n=1 Tax=Ceriporiopsis subvermispora (strain B) TaxID=914234 RepID=M2PAD1_CERS8|nr:hypothetical protein CERSUDRAFT_99521 [Gelatoporia subvermispora B]
MTYDHSRLHGYFYVCLNDLACAVPCPSPYSLFGVTTIQSYQYFQRSDKDTPTFRTAIAFLWILDTVHQVLICQAIYTYTVTEYGNILALTKETWAVMGSVFVTAIMDLLVRAIFSVRIWRFSNGNWFVVGPIVFCSLGEFGSMLSFEIKDKVVLHGQIETQQALSTEFYFGVMFCLVSDTLIAVTQVVYLWRHRTGIPRTNFVIRTLIMYCVNTGLLTTLCALALVITWTTMPQNLVYISLFAALPTLLFNALLATLNARQELRELAKPNTGVISIPLSAVAQTSSTGAAKMGRTIMSLHASDSRTFAMEQPRYIV